MKKMIFMTILVFAMVSCSVGFYETETFDEKILYTVTNPNGLPFEMNYQTGGRYAISNYGEASDLTLQIAEESEKAALWLKNNGDFIHNDIDGDGRVDTGEEWTDLDNNGIVDAGEWEDLDEDANIDETDERMWRPITITIEYQGETFSKDILNHQSGSIIVWSNEYSYGGEPIRSKP